MGTTTVAQLRVRKIHLYFRRVAVQSSYHHSCCARLASRPASWPMQAAPYLQKLHDCVFTRLLTKFPTMQAGIPPSKLGSLSRIPPPTPTSSRKGMAPRATAIPRPSPGAAATPPQCATRRVSPLSPTNGHSSISARCPLVAISERHSTHLRPGANLSKRCLQQATSRGRGGRTPRGRRCTQRGRRHRASIAHGGPRRRSKRGGRLQLSAPPRSDTKCSRVMSSCSCELQETCQARYVQPDSMQQQALRTMAIRR